MPTSMDPITRLACAAAGAGGCVGPTQAERDGRAVFPLCSLHAVERLNRTGAFSGHTDETMAIWCGAAAWRAGEAADALLKVNVGDTGVNLVSTGGHHVISWPRRST